MFYLLGAVNEGTTTVESVIGPLQETEPEKATAKAIPKSKAGARKSKSKRAVAAVAVASGKSLKIWQSILTLYLVLPVYTNVHS